MAAGVEPAEKAVGAGVDSELPAGAAATGLSPPPLLAVVRVSGQAERPSVVEAGRVTPLTLTVGRCLKADGDCSCSFGEATPVVGRRALAAGEDAPCLGAESTYLGAESYGGVWVFPVSDMVGSP